MMVFDAEHHCSTERNCAEVPHDLWRCSHAGTVGPACTFLCVPCADDQKVDQSVPASTGASGVAASGESTHRDAKVWGFTHTAGELHSLLIPDAPEQQG